MLPEHIGFGVVAAIMIVGALRVVTTKNVVHAALWLVVVLAGAAAQYLLLAAEFVAITQVLVYVGAIMVLFLFGTMLTRAQIGKEKDLDNKYRTPAVVVSLLILGVMVLRADRSVPRVEAAEGVRTLHRNTEQVSDSALRHVRHPVLGLCRSCSRRP